MLDSMTIMEFYERILGRVSFADIYIRCSQSKRGSLSATKLC